MRPGPRLIALGALVLAMASPARAQVPVPGGAPGGAPVDRNAPVTFTADDVQYDRDAAIVTASGHVEAWQNDRTLRADKIVFDRNTGVAAASGHVVLMEPDGQVLFSDYAELTQDMKDGVLSGMRTLLAQNGRLAANGARRTDAKLNELSRAIYTTCNLCAKDPTRPPLWDIRAREAVQDVEHKRIEYRDAVIDIYGIPVMYLPYLTHPDPSQKRASGLLVPSFGLGSKHLGAFASVPYYVAIDDSSDLTASAFLTAQAGEGLDLAYRKRFNFGTVNISGSLADEHGVFNDHIFARGQFALNDVWRYGFDINRASSAAYVRDFRIAPAVPNLGSTLYIEGFGQGSYARTNVSFYQSLTTTTATNRLPFVLPRTQYSYFGQPDALGGRLMLEAGAFNVVRDGGASTERANLSLGWQRPFLGPVGDVWKASFDVDSAAYSARGLADLPTYSAVNSASTTQAMPTASLEARLPFARDAGPGMGTQILEPIAKLMLSPRGSSYRDGRTPNEDSLDTEFTDATLFSRNRSQGVDRLEGGARMAVALHAMWTFPQGAQLDGLIGQAYRAQKDPYFAPQSGLQGTVSDYVARQSFSPAPVFDLTARERIDHRSLQIKYAEATASAGPDFLRVGAGYLYSTTTPYALYDAAPSAIQLAAYNTPRNEVSLNASTRYGAWRLNAAVRRDVRSNKFVGIDAGGTYEDECFIFDVHFYRRYTSVLADSGDSGLLFNITLKTVGEFGFHAN